MNWYSLVMWAAILVIGLLAGPLISWATKKIKRYKLAAGTLSLEESLLQLQVSSARIQMRKIKFDNIILNPGMPVASMGLPKEKPMTSSGYVTEWKRLKVVLDDMERNPEKSDPRATNKIRTTMIQYFNRMSPAEQKEIAKLYIPNSPIEE